MSVLNQSGDEPVECPLCMEQLEVDDLNFYPCTCGYQICRFCWHRIRTDENGLCPACRKAYPENPADFRPLTTAEVQRLKSEKRLREQQRKQKVTESRQHLASVRVVQRNLVFVVGLPMRLADSEVLKKHEYFGKFGKIIKVVINQSTSYAGSQGPSASAYVTYHRAEDALRAIAAVNNIAVDGRTLKASLGTTKYCSHFMKNQPCPKTECMYLHDLGDPEASFTKEDMQQGKHQEYEKKLHEQLLNNTTSHHIKETNINNNTNSNSMKEAWPSLLQGGSREDVVEDAAVHIKATRHSHKSESSASAAVNGGGGSHKKRHTSGEEPRGRRKGRDKGHTQQAVVNNNNNNCRNQPAAQQSAATRRARPPGQPDTAPCIAEGGKLQDPSPQSASPSSSTSSLSESVAPPPSRSLSNSSSSCSSASSSISEDAGSFTAPQENNSLEWAEPASVPVSHQGSDDALSAPPPSVPAAPPAAPKQDVLPDWQVSFNFGANHKPLPAMQNNRLGVTSQVEDELGFDPFAETQKGLAELMETEQQQQQQQQQQQRTRTYQQQQMLKQEDVIRNLSHMPNNSPLMPSLTQQQQQHFPLNMQTYRYTPEPMNQYGTASRLMEPYSPHCPSTLPTTSAARPPPPPGFSTAPPTTHTQFTAMHSGSKVLPYLGIHSSASGMNRGATSNGAHMPLNNMAMKENVPFSLSDWHAILPNLGTSVPVTRNQTQQTTHKEWNPIDWTTMDPAIVAASPLMSLGMSGGDSTHTSGLFPWSKPIDTATHMYTQNHHHVSSTPWPTSVVAPPAAPPPGFSHTLRSAQGAAPERATLENV